MSKALIFLAYLSPAPTRLQAESNYQTFNQSRPEYDKGFLRGSSRSTETLRVFWSHDLRIYQLERNINSWQRYVAHSEHSPPYSDPSAIDTTAQDAADEAFVISKLH